MSKLARRVNIQLIVAPREREKDNDKAFSLAGDYDNARARIHEIYKAESKYWRRSEIYARLEKFARTSEREDINRFACFVARC